MSSRGIGPVASSGLVVASVLSLAACWSGSAAPTKTTLPSAALSTTSEPASTTSQPSTSKVAWCTTGQLDVGGLGSSTATGTGVLTVRITNTSATACALGGWPIVTFTRAGDGVIATNVAHLGPGPAFRAPATIVLRPGLTSTAGFVVTSRDIPSENNICQSVSAIRVSLPRVAGTFAGSTLQHLSSYHLCDPGHPVDISGIVGDAVLDGYAPAWPTCLATQLRFSVSALGAAAGAATYVGTFTNTSTAVCTLEGYPRVTLRNAAGQAVATFLPGVSAGTSPQPPRPRPVTVAPALTAQFIFSAADWDPVANGGRGTSCPPSTQLSVTLPGDPGAFVLHHGLELCFAGGVGAVTGPGVTE